MPLFRSGCSIIWKYDGLGQYYPVFLYIGEYIRDFFDHITEGRMVLPAYDLSIGMGEDIAGCLNYYGFGDPVNFLAVFSNMQNGSIVFCISYFLRLYLAGLALQIYCREMKLGRIPSLVGAFLYIFSGFAICGGGRYIEWLSVLFYFPLMLAGIEKMIKDRKRSGLFLFSVIYGALCGFYYLYMSSLALAVYCLVRLFSLYGLKNIKNIVKICMRSLIWYMTGLLIAGPVFFPAVAAFLVSERNSRITEVLLKRENYIPNVILLKFFLVDSIMPSAAYNYWNGIVIMEWLAVIALFFLPNTRKRMQLKTGILFSILAVSIPMTGYLFNAFGETNNRWAYLVHFVFIVSFVSVLTDMSENELPSIRINRKVFAGVVYTLVLGNIVVNTWHIFSETAPDWEFIKMNEVHQYTDSPCSVSEIISNDTDFFRVSNDSFTGINERPENIAMLHGYYGLTYWFSIINGNTQNCVDRYNGRTMEWRSFGFAGDPHMEALAGCKYYVSPKILDSPEYEMEERVRFNHTDWYVYRNLCYMGMCYLYRGDISENETVFEEDAETAYLHMTSEGVLSCEYDNKKNTFFCRTDSDQEEMLIIAVPYHHNWQVYIDGEKGEKERSGMYTGVRLQKGTHEVRMRYSRRDCPVWMCSGFLLLWLMVRRGGSIILRKKVNGGRFTDREGGNSEV